MFSVSGGFEGLWWPVTVHVCKAYMYVRMYMHHSVNWMYSTQSLVREPLKRRRELLKSSFVEVEGVSFCSSVPQSLQLS